MYVYTRSYTVRLTQMIQSDNDYNKLTMTTYVDNLLKI